MLGEFYRTGRRHRRADGRGVCMRKPRVRQRKATPVARPYHLKLAAAYASLMGLASARAGLKGGGVMPVSGVAVQKQNYGFCLVQGRLRRSTVIHR